MPPSLAPRCKVIGARNQRVEWPWPEPVARHRLEVAGGTPHTRERNETSPLGDLPPRGASLFREDTRGVGAMRKFFMVIAALIMAIIVGAVVFRRLTEDQ